MGYLYGMLISMVISAWLGTAIWLRHRIRKNKPLKRDDIENAIFAYIIVNALWPVSWIVLLISYTSVVITKRFIKWFNQKVEVEHVYFEPAQQAKQELKQQRLSQKFTRRPTTLEMYKAYKQDRQKERLEPPSPPEIQIIK